MNTQELNMMPIKDYLASNNIHPVKDRGYYGMYHSPFREDSNASLKVDFSKNLWIDFGANEGGTLIDLVMRMRSCDFKEAVAHLEQKYQDNVPEPDNFSFHGKSFSAKPEPVRQTIAVLKIQSLTNQALIDYLDERYINLDITRQHCKEIHYSVGSKEYYAIGFKNDSGGYVLRNKYFKGCTSSDITTHTSVDTSNKEACLVFESFTDYLSFLTLKNMDRPKQDAVILNSVHNLSKAMDFIRSHKQVYAYLDNDDAGRRTTEAIKANCRENTVSDQSAHYAKYKDLNDYLSAVKQVQKPVKKQSNLKIKR